MPVDPWDAVAGLEVLEAAQHSAVTGQVVPITGKLRPETTVIFLPGSGISRLLSVERP
jgi:hypothetical protein